MLFSDPGVADLINKSFEPVWQSVRPVPTVKIDFGNGRVITRTLHGNIATYVLTADGKVLDILPGIYEPAVYKDRLEQLGLLSRYANQFSESMRPAALAYYHKRQALALAGQGTPPRLVTVKNPLADMNKHPMRRPIAVVFARPAAADSLPAPSSSEAQPPRGRDSLLADTSNNETIRRRQIHAMLAATGMIGPEQITKWLYKEVLHADLDDPYLGLSETLFANYPFKDQQMQ